MLLVEPDDGLRLASLARVGGAVDEAFGVFVGKSMGDRARRSFGEAVADFLGDAVFGGMAGTVGNSVGVSVGAMVGDAPSDGRLLGEPDGLSVEENAGGGVCLTRSMFSETRSSMRVPSRRTLPHLAAMLARSEKHIVQ